MLWLLLVPLAVLYAASFRTFPIIDQKDSVLADADAANFKYLLEHFSLTRKLGNEYAIENRTVADIAQKHKIHHVLYGIVGWPIYASARAVERGLGGTGERAAYTVNAVLTCLNVLLLYLLVRGSTRPASRIWPFLILYAFSLSTWIFAAIPESWPFSATLVMLFMYLSERRLLPPLGLAAVLGVFMLNNMVLGGLLLLLGIRFLGEGLDLWTVARRSVAAFGVTMATWLGCLLFLGQFDESLRPDRLYQYTVWFRQFVGADLDFTDLYVWKSLLSNLYLNTFASQQTDPSVPQEALKYTLQTAHPLGLAATAATALLLGLTGLRLGSSLRADLRTLGWRDTLRTNAALWPAVWGLAMIPITYSLFYGAGFLYSCVVVPSVVLVMARVLDWSRPVDRWTLTASLGLMVANNAVQVMVFREALRPLG